MRSAKDDLQNTSRIARQYYPWISLAATSPLRPAQTDLQNTKAQHQQRREVTWNPQLHLRTQIEPTSMAKRRRQSLSRTRANCSPQRNLRFPKKTQCVLQFLTFKSHPSCSSFNAICQGWLARHKQNRKTLLPLDKPCHNQSTAICTGWTAKLNSTASKWKSHLEPSVTLRTQIEPNSTQSDDAEARRAT